MFIYEVTKKGMQYLRNYNESTFTRQAVQSGVK